MNFLAKNLVIVESPTKAKTISKMLGSQYKVIASVGHLRDLPKSRMGVNIEDDFEPEYINVRGKGDIIKNIKKETKNAEKVFLATDPDREGEAISWHLNFILGLDLDQANRVVFQEITKEAVKKAIQEPRKIDMDLVDAQQARRVLDRIVGYNLSPLLWKKVKSGLSAGRVQSVALKLVCDREKEIREFVKEEYWTVHSTFLEQKQSFEANLKSKLINGKEVKIEIPEEKEADRIISEIKGKENLITKVTKRKKRKNPYPPHTTSTLQQDSYSKLGFSTGRTMSIAQQLYEGISIGKEGTVGLISYMRTDSTRLSNEIIQEALQYIRKEYGENYSSKGVNYGKQKKGSQDAHEAIRPSSIQRSPKSLRSYLTDDQYKLYNLIWTRVVASQMMPAQYESTSVQIQNGEYILQSNGLIELFDGFTKVYTVGGSQDKILPDLKKGTVLKEISVDKQQHFTKPKPRYTEASLVKTLEEDGIGRPSTYSSIISSLLKRHYVEIKEKKFFSTQIGENVNEFLSKYFKDIVNEEFTAGLEKELDEIADDKKDWKKVISVFYDKFEGELDKAKEAEEKFKIKDQPIDEICPECGNHLVIKHGRNGKFIGCSNFPDCKFTKTIVKSTGIECPKCKTGDMIEKVSKRGKVFYGCSSYPKCDYALWDKPTGEKCPKCGSLLVHKKNRKMDKILCSNENCDYEK